MSDASANPYLFAVGCARSGTTLLQRMLDSHPELAVANDTHFIPDAVEDLDVTHDLPLTEELVERVRSYRRFYRFGLSDAEVDEAADGADTYRAFVTRLYTIFARKRGKRLGGEKTPSYGRHLGLLHTLFPEARVVHIVRDGRDVALSVLEWAEDRKGPAKWTLWDESPLAATALWWRRQVERGRRDGLRLGTDRYHEVRYETLVERPEEELRAICAFLDLPYSTKMPAFHEGKTRAGKRLSAKSAWLPATRGLRDWRRDMDDVDAALFEALAGDALASFGYERAWPTAPPEVEARAARYRHWWIESGRTRSRKKAPARSFQSA